MVLVAKKQPWIGHVGQEAGKEIRRAVQSYNATASKCPHIRHVHWHRFWSGPCWGEQEFNLKRRPPILAGGE